MSGCGVTIEHVALRTHFRMRSPRRAPRADPDPAGVRTGPSQGNRPGRAGEALGLVPCRIDSRPVPRLMTAARLIPVRTSRPRVLTWTAEPQGFRRPPSAPQGSGGNRPACIQDLSRWIPTPGPARSLTQPVGCPALRCIENVHSVYFETCCGRCTRGEQWPRGVGLDRGGCGRPPRAVGG